MIQIEEGDTIPADGRVIRSIALRTAEASLTGESLAMSKDSDSLEEELVLGDYSNMVFSGTAATYGRGRAVVTTTGQQPEMDKTAGLLPVGISLVRVTTILPVEGVREFNALVAVLILPVALAVDAVAEGLPPW